jgi:hypothetical protein
MKRFMLVGGLLALTISTGCSSSEGVTTQPPIVTLPTGPWSNSELKVSPNDPTAQGTIFGIVVDSVGGGDPTHETPIAGASVVLGSMMPPAASGQGSSTAIAVIGHVVADASGRFVITSVPKGYYYVGAEAQDGTLRAGATRADLRGSDGAVEVTVYVPHISQ